MDSHKILTMALTACFKLENSDVLRQLQAQQPGLQQLMT
jgi:hypothetical protein